MKGILKQLVSDSHVVLADIAELSLAHFVVFLNVQSPIPEDTSFNSGCSPLEDETLDPGSTCPRFPILLLLEGFQFPIDTEH